MSLSHLETRITTVFCTCGPGQSDPSLSLWSAHSGAERAERRRSSRSSRTGDSPASQEIQSLRRSRTSHSRTRRKGQEKNKYCDVSIWSGDRSFRCAGHLSLAPEKVILQDMLSDIPRISSISQLRPMEYWEKAAATLPNYEGPWQPPTILKE
ncbi:hypothetical protein SRHO_G00047820 [Serrasalmus rhombeus]